MTQTTVGEAIRAARKRQALSQEEVARRADLSWRTVWNIEKGVSVPRDRTLRDIAAALGLEVTDLTALTEDVA